MTNPYYAKTGNPVNYSFLSSSLIRAEFALLQAAFDLLPPFSGNAGKAVVINGGASALSLTSGTLSLAGNFATTGGILGTGYNTTLVQTASIALTLPSSNGTIATLAGLETLSGKTIQFSNAIAAPSAFETGFMVYLDVADGNLKAKSGASNKVTVLATT